MAGVEPGSGSSSGPGQRKKQIQEFYPTTEEGVEEVVRWALATKTPLEVIGLGSKHTLGHEVRAGARLHLERLAGILSYEPEELVISAWAGTPLVDIEAILAAEGQHLAFEPPSGEGTLGGVVATGLAGPRRLAAGSVRDHVLGVTGITGRGETFKIGGRVVKNVTGYDLAKLLTGSFGCLAVMTRITVKVLPAPRATRTLHLSNRTRNETLGLLRRAAASPFSVTAAAMKVPSAHVSQLIDDGSTGETFQDHGIEGMVRLEGRADEIDQRMELLKTNLDVTDYCVVPETSKELWREMANPLKWPEAEIIWRLNLPRARADDVAQLLAEQTSGQVIFDWAGARAWVLFKDSQERAALQIRELVRGAGKTPLFKAALFRAPQEIKADLPVFAPEPKALAALSVRIRDAFDPERILNPGRMGAE